MSIPHIPRDNANALVPATANGQLKTPALTPVSEHGDQGNAPFASHDEDVDHTTTNGRLNGTTNGESHVKQSALFNTQVTSGQEMMSQKSNAPISPRTLSAETPKVLKLSPNELQALTSSPGSIPMRPASPLNDDIPPLANGLGLSVPGSLAVVQENVRATDTKTTNHTVSPSGETSTENANGMKSVVATPGAFVNGRPGKSSRSASSPVVPRKSSSFRGSKPTPLKLDNPLREASSASARPTPNPETSQPSPMPPIIPMPPLSLPTYLQLELSSDRPSPLYIHRPTSSDFPYESSKVKFERLLNFLRLPPLLEQVLVFGALACLDSWLFTFTILPLRFLKAIGILLKWSARTIAKEARDLSAFVYDGIGRVWQRRQVGPESRRPSVSEPATSRPSSRPPSRRPSESNGGMDTSARPTLKLDTSSMDLRDRSKRKPGFRHRRTRSTPSALMPNHKADLLQGALILISSTMLMWFDASRMYHSIRGQAAIKLYVIYNVLEVFDRLLSALGQDVLECLFSKETLERNPNGRSKVIRPLWMFLLALLYNIVHATMLFYQVVTLNVAVNSYSNALLTLLMSNQFVEIKGTVFKKFEKENLFQLTCADVVERFQLWLMLMIIALRNIVEIGGLTISLGSSPLAGTATSGLGANATGLAFKTSIIPKAFTLLPRWTGEVLGPFLIVLGSEMIVDWLKHAYISKFNNVKPDIYGRFLDVLAKDYYSHAFADQNLTKRLGLPVIPLSCLFIRASMQTYHMLLATHMPMPVPAAATAVALDLDSASTSPTTMKALQHVDHIFRRALGRSSFGAGMNSGAAFSWSMDDFIALATMVIFFLAIFLILLVLKLVLGMALLSFARSRYKGMKERERQPTDTKGKRVGGWGVVEVGEEKRRWIYDDDPDALRELREKEAKAKAKAEKAAVETDGLDGVGRYMMAAKRIW